jgi:putative hemolysin
LLLDEFSYAAPQHSLPRKLLIRSIELATGQQKLKRVYQTYRKANLPKHAFWSEVMLRLHLKPKIYGNPAQEIPETGPLIVVANHPYGVLDGLAICWLVSQHRRDFKILINSVLCRLDEMADHVLPIDFEPTREAMQTNLASRKAAREWVESGGALIVFPAGAISTTSKLYNKKAEDAPWAPLVGQLVRRTRAPVLPVFFEGQNSAMFQWASHVNENLRAALIFREVKRRMYSSLRLVVGEALTFEALEPHLPASNLAKYLQAHTHDLQRRLPDPVDKP